MQEEFKVLSLKEERALPKEDIEVYYKNLREYALKRKLTNTTPGALTVAPKLKGITEKIAKKVSTVLAGGDIEIVSDGQENIPKEAVIFAMSHQGIMDNFIWIPETPRHCLMLHHMDVNKLLILAQMNTGMILVGKKEGDGKNKKDSKMDMIKVLLKGHSIIYCPEGTWNLSPNKLHLPMRFGFCDVAKKSGTPIVPVVVEYTYDTSTEKERITKAHIRFGKPIYVNIHDELSEKLLEYEEAISTIRWELIEEKGFFKRSDTTNYDYINYMKGNLATLNLGKVSLEFERKGLRDADNDFYIFHHINDVPFDAWGELLETDEVRKLKRINRTKLRSI